ncbi:carbon-nitrogen hydrolase family protein [Vibrio sp. SM6]|uniref:Carbon-nitrogen hydrolase family protein n=1 Tax=Vibrio agarilyticus TaxID=2726741 RepID=A0A7X8TTN8_9VIBR|nr:carbon-nitrogen hydrolase family protein [Vibrio agarilyticus]NLS14614.1 carbon-nitrogen hydrolase family protein [Vibrio agarilyticus]
MERVAIIQMTSGPDELDNLATIERAYRQAVSRGASLVVTPENALVFGHQDDYVRVAEPLGEGPLQRKLSQLTAAHGATLVIGSFPLRHRGGISTSTLVFDGHGECIAHYDKLHMFDVDIEDGHGRYRESDSFTPGEQIVVAQTPNATLGLSICYDLRFPGLYQSLRALGSDIILVPAAFTAVTGEAHWHVLLRARAIETQCWVVAAAQGGIHPCGRQTFGHSLVVNPWGEIVAELEHDRGVLLADLNLEYNAQLRRQMPTSRHNRFCSQLIPIDTSPE